jgi:hypothetical protein
MIDRLVNKGMEITSIPALIRNVANLIAINPYISLSELNDRMHSLGWDTIDLDQYTLDLIIAVLGSDLDKLDSSEKANA